jgi:Txe/YoeB family toxin of Txe-Axe toxin-antitoxin module
MEDWTKLLNDKHRNVYALHISVIKTLRARHGTHTGAVRNPYKTLVTMPEGLGQEVREMKWRNDIKVELRDVYIYIYGREVG